MQDAYGGVKVVGTAPAGTGAEFEGFGAEYTDDKGFIVAFDIPVPAGATRVSIKDGATETGSGDVTNDAGKDMLYIHYFANNKKKVTRTFEYTVGENTVTVTYVLDASGVVNSAMVGNVDLSDVGAMDIDEIREAFASDPDFAGLSDVINTQDVVVTPVVKGNTLTLKTTGSYTLSSDEHAEFPGFNWSGSTETPANGYIVVYKLAVPEGATKLTYNNGHEDKTIDLDGDPVLSMAVYFEAGEQRMSRDYSWEDASDNVLAKMTYVYDVSGMKKN